MTTRLHPIARRWRRLSASALGLAVVGGTLLSSAAQAAPALVSNVAKVAATNQAAPAVTVPAADVLDVAFTNGTAIDRATGLPAKTWGAPTYTTDPVFGHDILKVNGVNDAVSFDFTDQWSRFSAGFAIECVFRVDTTMPVSGEKDLCSDKEAGGFSVYVNGGNLGTMAHIGGGYKSVLTPISGNRWYHTVSVWDGRTLSLYVNGQLAGSTAATGALTPPVATARFFVIGADAAPNNIGQVAPPSSYAASKVWSSGLTGAQVAELASAYNTKPPVPVADVLDVDFHDGTPKDNAQNLAVTVHGDPVIAQDTAVKAKVATFDGIDDAYSYAFGDQWSKINTRVSIECTLKSNGTLPNSGEHSVCSEKESGGYSMVIYGDKLTFTAYVGGGYKNAQTPIVSGRWYHAVGTWDGQMVRLYVDGVLAAATPAAGTLGLPTGNARNHFYIGADAINQFWAPASVRSTRIYSKVLTLDEVEALNVAALGDVRDAGVAVTSTVPAEGARLSRPTEFKVTVTNQGNATGWRYLLDGEPIQVGQEIGPGMKSGSHTLRISANDVFGKPISKTVTFTSDAIPASGGTDVGQGKGQVTLSAIAHNPDGGPVTTTFKQATPSIPTGGIQGVVPVMPSTLDFSYTEGGQIGTAPRPGGKAIDSPSTRQIPFQRYDVQVPASAERRQILWSGVVDPARAVALHAWNSTTQSWTELATARGQAEGDTALKAVVRPELVDNGVVHVLVTGQDPFADDLAPREATAGAPGNKDHFEDPSDYDFALAHFTDTQYLAEGAVGGTYDNFNGIDEPSDKMTMEEQALWAKSYRDTTQWLADNAAKRKIAYTAHTGDIIENDYYDPLATDANGKLLRPGLDEQVTKEFQFTSEAQRTLDSAGLVNQVVAGNHDNQLGAETGPTSRFNKYYGPERYYEAAKLWPADAKASYHAWDEVTDASGAVVTRGKDNQNNYVLFSAGGLDFVSVGLSYGVTQAEADWASSIFRRYHDRNGILLTHAYLAPSTTPDGRGAGFSTDGSRAFSSIVAANPNVFLVLAGHEHGVGTNLKTGVGVTIEHNVVELLADYQFYKMTAGELWPEKVDAQGNLDLDGDGVVDHKKDDLLQFGASFLRLLQIDVARAQMSVDTYSPMLGTFGATAYDDRKRYNGAEDNMVLPIDLSTRKTSFSTESLVLVTPTDTVIGQDTAKSGWPATVKWSGLTERELYAWTTTSHTGDGDQVGMVDQFGGIFIATAAGTDVTPPVLTVPATTSVKQGQDFDPLAGVTAVDNTDGDITDRIQVIGAVDTATPGSYALTYLVSDTNGNQAVANRAVTVTAAPIVKLTPTSVKTKDVKVDWGKTLTLTAEVKPDKATGPVQFMIGEDVLCEDVLKKGKVSCTVRMLPGPGTHKVRAIYGGDQTHEASYTEFTLTVAAVKLTPTSVKAKDVKVDSGKTLTLTADVKPDKATGPVQFMIGDDVLCEDVLKKGTVSCTVRTLPNPGTYKVRAVYGGDEAHAASYAEFTLTVAAPKR
ncbi:LamG-like jellyroll fold domain-containing protein [Micromonospora sp. NPDC006766]|uniref:LamG-like jellyroll fold domain-containing protein n=1 Tax=Micromonospora sp. NPDC006766 TaxID=3154778 RepID=UPI0033D9202C